MLHHPLGVKQLKQKQAGEVVVPATLWPRGPDIMLLLVSNDYNAVISEAALSSREACSGIFSLKNFKSS